jgi:endogenous inhibitor of DNA gyrase (YacG/DUF329 family)
MPENTPRTVMCPTCEKPVAWIEDNKFRPFCCERCKLIDFGGWATEKHTIAGEPVFDPEDNEDNLQ